MGEDSVRAVAPVVTVMVGGMATVVRMGVARVRVVEARVEVAMMVAVMAVMLAVRVAMAVEV
jgi:hypothetical protein